MLIAGSGDNTLLGASGSDTFELYASNRNSHAGISNLEVGRDVVELNLEGGELIEGVAPMPLTDRVGVSLLLGGFIINILSVTVQELKGADWLNLTS